jgi:uncharacterized protein
MMTILVDSSYLFALFNHDDPYHDLADKLTLQSTDKLVVPIVVLPEVTFLFRRDMVYWGIQYFMQLYTAAKIPIENVTMEDLQRVKEIMKTYETAKFDLVDCCIMALAERLNITRICTFDHTDFRIFRPKHCEYFELLP